MIKRIMYRLIADEGKLLTDGTVCGKVIDLAPDADESAWTEFADEYAAAEQNVSSDS
ncbi:MAG: hypothetical protein PUB85_05415 [Clostridia bacterium]|nr:hypothetical protein [Clostridia bacterium]